MLFGNVKGFEEKKPLIMSKKQEKYYNYFKNEFFVPIKNYGKK